HLKERLVFEDAGAHEVMTLAAFHTHVFESFDTNPRVLFTAQKEDMGKSVAQKLYASLCPRSHIFVTATDAVLKRVGKHKPTAHMDEIDGSLKGRELLRVIIDGGWNRSTAATIMTESTGENTWDVRSFDVFFPMSLAGIGTPHRTIVSRSFVLRMGNRRKETAPRDPKTGELIEPFSGGE